MSLLIIVCISKVFFFLFHWLFQVLTSLGQDKPSKYLQYIGEQPRNQNCLGFPHIERFSSFSWVLYPIVKVDLLSGFDATVYSAKNRHPLTSFPSHHHAVFWQLLGINRLCWSQCVCVLFLTKRYYKSSVLFVWGKLGFCLRSHSTL